MSQLITRPTADQILARLAGGGDALVVLGDQEDRPSPGGRTINAAAFTYRGAKVR